MAGNDLTVLNVGSVSTCVRPQGESIVHITLVSRAAARRVRQWRVAAELETLSDHRYIELRFLAVPHKDMLRGRSADQQRWSVKKINVGLLMESLYAQTWPGVTGQGSVDEEWERIRDIVWCACNTSMPRFKLCPKRSAYW